MTSKGEDVRDEILDYVKKHPGVKLPELADYMQMGTKTVHYHLVKLREEKQVSARRVREGGSPLAYFPPNGSKSRGSAPPKHIRKQINDQETMRQVIRLLSQNNGGLAKPELMPEWLALTNEMVHGNL